MVLNIWKLSNNAFEQVAIIDYATSVIWVEPFQDIGKFELYVRATPELVSIFKDNEIFITRNDRQRGMYVETCSSTPMQRAAIISRYQDVRQKL